MTQHDAELPDREPAAENPYEPPLTAELVDAAIAIDAEKKPPPELRRPQPHIGWSLILVLLTMAVQIAVVAAVVFVIIFVKLFSGVHPDQISELEPDLAASLVPIATFSTFCTALIIAWVLMRRNLGRKLALRSCTPWQWLLVLLLLFPQSVVASELANLVMEVVRTIDSPLLDALNDMSWVEAFARQPWALVFLGACVFPALGEEILFRGVLSRGLIAWHGLVAGSILASVLFGLMHLAPAQALATIVIGLVLQLIFVSTRSLWAPIVLHLLNNAMAFAMISYGQMIPIPGYTVESAEQVVDQVEHVSPLLVLAALVTTVALLALLFQSRTRWQLPDGSEWSPGYFATESPPVELDARPVTRMPQPLLIGAAGLAMIAFAAAFYFALTPV